MSVYAVANFSPIEIPLSSNPIKFRRLLFIMNYLSILSMNVIGDTVC